MGALELLAALLGLYLVHCGLLLAFVSMPILRARDGRSVEA